MERVLLYEEALAEVLRQAEGFARVAQTAPQELAALLAAQGRVLAEPIVADRDQPPFPRSTRDGYAVRSDDLLNDGARLRLVGGVRAGERWTGAPLRPGEALEIMTGAPLPEGADAVLMVEHAALDSGATGEGSGVSPAGWVQPADGRRLRAGENVVPRGAEAREGTVLVPAGRRVHTPEISVAASCGYAALPVYRRPRVAVLATGDELVELNERPEVWQIRNSNSYALASLIEAEGGVPMRLSVARDTLGDLRERLCEALAADLVLLSGGVSMGKYDLVEEVLREAGAEFYFTGARIQPGKPVVFGRLRPMPGVGGGPGLRESTGLPFFGLPGNPISTEVCFRLFVAPLLRALCGRVDRAPSFAEARLAEEVRGGAGVTRFLPAILTGDWQRVSVCPVPWQGSGDLAANARANSFVVLPLGVERFPEGETVRVLLR